MRASLHVVDRLAEFVSGSLSKRETQRLEDHVGHCETCAARLEEWRRVVGAVRHTNTSPLNPMIVRRISAAAQARRVEILERRRFHRLITLFAVSAWIVFLASLPILSELSMVLGKHWNWSPSWAIAIGLLAWGSVCWMMGLSMIPVLRMHLLEKKEKRP